MAAYRVSVKRGVGAGVGVGVGARAGGQCLSFDLTGT